MKSRLLTACVCLVTAGLALSVLRGLEKRSGERQRWRVAEAAAECVRGIEVEALRTLSAVYLIASLAGAERGFDAAADGAVEARQPPGGDLLAVMLLPHGEEARFWGAELSPIEEAGLKRALPRLTVEIRQLDPSKLNLIGPLAVAPGAEVLCATVGIPEEGGAPSSRGQAVACLRVGERLAANYLQRLAGEGIDYQLILADSNPPGPNIIAKSTETELPNPIERRIELGTRAWWLVAAPRGGWHSWRQMGPQILTASILVLLAGAFTFDLASRPELLREQAARRSERLLEVNRRLAEQVAERERFEERLQHRALHDELTDLPNRALFLTRLKRALRRTRSRRNGGGELAVLAVGLDRFKKVTDSLGPAVGDRLLVALARRLDALVQPQEVVARLSGGEFAILLFDVKRPQDTERFATRLQAVIERAFDFQGQEVFVSASVGIAVTSEHYAQSDELLRGAELAMHQANAEGGARVVRFDPSMHLDAVKKVKLEAELRRAIEQGELQPYFMPIVSLSCGSVAGFEALVRWPHPDRGMVSPAEFVPLAEETGLIVDIDRWMLRQACHQGAKWSNRFAGEAPYVSVNLSALDLARADLYDDVVEALAEAAYPADRLGLEVTESMVMDSASLAHQSLSRLREHGTKVLIDDFGTGYSSLGYLHQLPFDVLKIDYSFVHRIGANGENSEIVHTIVNLAKSLGKETVAEGPQNASHAQVLKKIGCDYGQGPFFSWAVDADRATELLEHRWRW